MIARPITAGEAAAYDELACARGSVFHRPDWTALFGARVVKCGVFGKRDKLVAGFHFFRVGPSVCSLLRNLPFTPSCGPFFRVESSNPVAVLEDKRNILAAMAAFLDQKSHALVSLALDRDIVDALPFVWREFKVTPRYTYRLDLSASEEARRRDMSPTRRNDLTKAARDGLCACRVDDFADVKRLVQAGFVRNEISGGASGLDAIFGTFARADNSYAFVTVRGEEPLAAVFVVHDAKTAFYLLSGYRSEGGHHGAGALALAAAIEHAASLGLKVFDFEGSMIPPIEKYFRGFGGDLTPFFTVNKAWLPLEMGLKLFKRHLF
jgi:hypothetical protein